MTVKPVRRVVGRALPLARENVDTDQIIPAHWLKRVARTGYGAGLFEAWRRDPSFVMNDHRYAGATIVVAGPNFGSGSSRGHAGWALPEGGFGAVVSSKVEDRFRSTALKGGCGPAVVAPDVAEKLMALATIDPDARIVIDVETRTIEAPGVRAGFALDDHARRRLLEGLDDIALTLAVEDTIDVYEQARPDWMPTVSRAR